MTDTLTDSAVAVERRGAVTWLRLQRPHAMNSISHVMLDELNLALKAIENDPETRAVVLTGSGRAFCAGADLKALVAADGTIAPELVVDFVGYAGRTIERLAALSMPVIAGVNGLALAGGLELILACDFVIASSSARIGDAHANFGLVPGAGASVRLPRAIGVPNAKYLALTGAAFEPTSAVLSGLVSEVVEPDALEARLTELADSLTSKSPLGLRRMKHLINNAGDLSTADALAAEQAALQDQCRSEDFTEGIAAFGAKRIPVYPGR
ncbi:MAG: Enoyl-CoA hydratase/isomerase [Marmoricola sp.]|nr:Enoyl-CoA hydratase/isomerase [Marmoricola sp.]